MKYLLFAVAILANLNTGLCQNLKLISDFKQTKVKVSDEFVDCSRDNKLGNCVSIAVIKCALGQFGTLDKIFKKFSAIDSGYIDVMFQDNFQITISKYEMEIVRNLSGIKPNQNTAYYQDAIIIYTCMCKRIYEKRKEFSERCILNFTNAVEYLNSGYPTVNGFNLLGLKKVNLSSDQIKTEPNAIVWCSAHAAFVSSGTQDLLGDPIQLRNNKMRNLARYSRIKGGYKLQLH